MRFVVLLVAAVIAVIAGVFALQMSSKNTPDSATSSGNASSPNVTTVDVLVAREAVPVGTVLTDEMIDRQPWPSHLVLDGFVTADSKDANLSGKVARAEFQPHEPFMSSKLGNPNDPSFLAAGLPAGMRAVTLAMDPVSGVAGYIFPGDRVDVILTHDIPQEIKNKRLGRRVLDKPGFAEVMVSGARVLAVNVRQPIGKESAASVSPSNITLAVSDVDAQKLRLAEKTGLLSLALRPLKDSDEAVLKPTQSGNLTRAGVSGQGTDAVRIIRGAGKSQDDVISTTTSDEAPSGELSPDDKAFPENSQLQ